MEEMEQIVAQIDEYIASSAPHIQTYYGAADAIGDPNADRQLLKFAVDHKGGDCCKVCLRAFNAWYIPAACQSRELYLRGVAAFATDLKNIPRKFREDADIIAASIALFGDNLRFAPMLETHWIAALNQNGEAIRWIPKEYWTAELCTVAAIRAPHLLRAYLPQQLDLERIVAANPEALKFIPYSRQTYGMCKYATADQIVYVNPIYVDAKFCEDRKPSSIHQVPVDLRKEVKITAIKSPSSAPKNKHVTTNLIAANFPEFAPMVRSNHKKYAPIATWPEHIICRVLQADGDFLRFVKYQTQRMVVAALHSPDCDAAHYININIPDWWIQDKCDSESQPLPFRTDDIDDLLCGNGGYHPFNNIELQINMNYYGNDQYRFHEITVEMYKMTLFCNGDHAIYYCVLFDEFVTANSEELAEIISSECSDYITNEFFMKMINANPKFLCFELLDQATNVSDSDLTKLIIDDALCIRNFGRFLTLEHCRLAYRCNRRALYYIPEEYREYATADQSGALTKRAP